VVGSLDLVHRRAIVWAQETNTLLSDFCEFKKGYHLETDVGVSYGSCVDKVGWITHPPLSASVSTKIGRIKRAVASTCKNVVRP
jgi:hypothetical protein